MKKNKNSLTACLVVFNEEKYIDRCLTSIKECTNEIIIVHDGPCKDQTLEIAKRYTDKIFVKKHIGIAEPHRVFALEQATGDWVMWIDADEFLSDNLKGEINRLMQHPSADAYEFIWPLWDGKKEITKNWPWRGILFRKIKLEYLGFPQEHFKTTGITKKLNFKINHQPNYNNFTWKSFKTKWVKWAKIQAKMYHEPFEKIPKYNYNKKDWPSNIKFSIKFPFLFPIFGAYAFIASLYSGGYKSLNRIKQSLMWSLYILLVYYFMFIDKLKRKYEI